MFPDRPIAHSALTVVLPGWYIALVFGSLDNFAVRWFAHW
jgi:hypothetical protein